MVTIAKPISLVVVDDHVHVQFITQLQTTGKHSPTVSGITVSVYYDSSVVTKNMGDYRLLRLRTCIQQIRLSIETGR